MLRLGAGIKCYQNAPRYIITSNLQSKFQEIELKNRAVTYRPKIELKHLTVSKIVLIRDTSWIRPKFDLIKGKNNNTTVNQVPMLTEAKFSFTIINNSDNLADIMGTVFFDTSSSIPKSVNDLVLMKGIDSLMEGYIQLDYLDTTTFSFTIKLSSLDSVGKFYLHFVVYCINQFDDIYQIYFVIKGTEKDPGYILVKKNMPYDLFRINKMFMKNNFITFDTPLKYINHIEEPLTKEIDNEFERIIKRHDYQEKLGEKILKK